MKKSTFLAAILLLAIHSKSFSQSEGSDYKPFKVDLSIGYAVPTGGGTGGKGGLLFAVEPKYAIKNEITVGLRMEGAIMISGITSDGTFTDAGTAKASSSYLATGDYYFGEPGGFRPFGGIGLGIFKTAGVSVSETNPNVATGSKFGGMLRAGFEYRHARVGIEYNLIGKSTVAPSTPGGTDGYTIKNGYLGVKFGVLIGGGARN